LAVSEQERAYFATLAPGRADLVPNGVDRTAVPMRDVLPETPSLLVMGSLSYSANVEAVVYLEREILPRLTHRDATAAVVGISPPPRVHRIARRSGGRIVVTGFVESTRPYLERSRVLVVPLRYGGGTRLKILEALAAGLPVVSTSIGCEGLGLEHEHDVLIADDPAAFARCVDRVLADDDLCHRLAKNGRLTAERRFDWSQIGGAMHEVLSQVVENRAGGPVVRSPGASAESVARQ
jgi:glycosyltransferase involved in cell wall biosynthesis